MRVPQVIISILSFFLLSGAVFSQSPRGQVLASQNEVMYVYALGKWKKWFHSDETMGNFQVGPRDLLNMTFLRDANSTIVISDVDLNTGKKTPNPPGLQRLRNLDSGTTIYKRDLGPAEVIFEYRGSGLVRTIQPNSPGYKGFRFLANGVYMFQYQPYQIEREGDSQLYVNTGSGNRLLLANPGQILYARFVNNGSHIVWLREISDSTPAQEEMTDDESDSDEDVMFDDDSIELLRFSVESVEVSTGKKTQLGHVSVEARWPDIAGQFVTWENSPNVALVKDDGSIQIVNALTGANVKQIQLADQWYPAQPLIQSFGGGDQGYSLGSHLVIVKPDKRKMQFLRNTDFSADFEIPLPGRQDSPGRVAFFPD